MSPKIHATAFVHPSAVLIDDVTLGEEVSVWPTAVLRGDMGFIRLGARTNFQDGAIAHATLGTSNTSVGDACTVGHRAVLHGCAIGNHCLVGIVLDNVEVGDWSFIAAGSLLTPGKKYEAGSFLVGSPAKRIRAVKDSEREWIQHSCIVYLELMRRNRSG